MKGSDLKKEAMQVLVDKHREVFVREIAYRCEAVAKAEIRFNNAEKRLKELEETSIEDFIKSQLGGNSYD